MIRTAIAAALAAAPIGARAQTTAADAVGGLVVEGQPRNVYVVRVPIAGRDASIVRQEIWSTAWAACSRAPRTGNTVETRPDYVQWCATEAAKAALNQYDVMLARRTPGSFVDIPTAPAAP
jgi:hypothetical protein